VDNTWQRAKQAADLAALDRLMADGFYEMNQYGRGRDRAEMLDLWRSFRIQSITTDSARVRLAGNIATVTGAQTERNNLGVERMLFVRVYMNDGKPWRLLSSTQFMRPDTMSTEALRGIG
jgi:hypothetical protein